MIGALLRRLREDRHGVATIEFALLSVLFFLVMTAGLDIAMWYQQRLRLDSAVEQGAMIAFNSRASVDQAAIGTYVAAAAKLASAPTVSISCNGNATCANSGRACACISGAAPTYSALGCDKTCSDGSLPGYYMRISATATASTLLVPAAMLGGTMTQTRTAMVRLQ